MVSLEVLVALEYEYQLPVRLISALEILVVHNPFAPTGLESVPSWPEDLDDRVVETLQLGPLQPPNLPETAVIKDSVQTVGNHDQHAVKRLMAKTCGRFCCV